MSVYYPTQLVKEEFLPEVCCRLAHSKNKYIRELTKMIDEGEKSGLIKYVRPRKTQEELEESSQESTKGSRRYGKLKRNRISARNSRQRKKIYLDLMEAKFAKLEAEKAQLDRALE